MMLLTPPDSPCSSPIPCPEDRLGLVLGGCIELTAILGTGAYGTVYKAYDVNTRVQYAVKALNRIGLNSRERSFQEREVRLHYLASKHTGVVSMKRILNTPDCTFVILEYCAEGDLFSKITDTDCYLGQDQKAKACFLQILDAVRHCHSNGIYHRDLKPENILVKDNGWTVKLADFGLATQESITSDFGCGSTFYMSPECLQPASSMSACYESAPNDVWSLGVILVNLACGRNPWKRASTDDQTFSSFLRNKNYLQTILPISEGLNHILQRVFEIDPKRRVSLNALRDLIMMCPTLGDEQSQTSLPPSPEYSPVLQPTSYRNSFQPMPHMDLLPAQQYPSTAAQHYTSISTPFPGFDTATPRRAPPGDCQPLRYAYPAKHTSPHAHGPAPTQPAFMPVTPYWARCGNFVPALAQHSCWRNVAIF